MTKRVANPNLISMRDIILITDPGGDPDDAWAIAHLALADKIKLKCIITPLNPYIVEKSSHWTAENAGKVLNMLPESSSCPVIAGSGFPVYAPEISSEDLKGAEALIELSADFTPEQRLMVAVIGPITDVALALEIDPSLTQRIEVVAMAFENWDKGQDLWNVRCDLKAWQSVLASEIPLTIGTSETCRSELTLSTKKAAKLLKGGDKLSSYLLAAFHEWVSTRPEECLHATGDKESWPVWDHIVVAHLLGLTNHLSQTRKILEDDLTLSVDPRGGSIQLIQTVNGKALWEEFAILF